MQMEIASQKLCLPSTQEVATKLFLKYFVWVTYFFIISLENDMKWWDLKPLLILNYSKAPFRDEKTNLRKQNNVLIVLQS